MAARSEYALEPRILDETDEEWIQRFAVGEEWWSHEITGFLRNDALEQGRQGLTPHDPVLVSGLQGNCRISNDVDGKYPDRDC